MSKFAQMLNLTLTGQERAARSVMRFATPRTDVSDRSGPYGVERQYRLEVKLSTKFWVSAEGVENMPNVTEMAVATMRRSMIEEMFGEFRPLLYQLHEALYGEDLMQARELLTRLENEMLGATP